MDMRGILQTELKKTSGTVSDSAPVDEQPTEVKTMADQPKIPSAESDGSTKPKTTEPHRTHGQRASSLQESVEETSINDPYITEPVIESAERQRRKIVSHRLLKA